MVDGRTRFARDIARRADAITAASVSTAEGLTFPADRDRAGLASPPYAPTISVKRQVRDSRPQPASKPISGIETERRKKRIPPPIAW